MNKYTIKQGDTLTNIAKQYGVSVSDLTSNNSIQNPNQIQVGQIITIPKKTSILGNILQTVFAPALTGNVLATGLNTNPVVSPTEVNIGNLPETPITPARETATVMSYKDNPDGTTTNFLSDGSTSVVKYAQNKDGSLTPTEVTPGSTIADPTKTDTTTTDPKVQSLLNATTSLNGEISTLEKSIADNSANRQSAYQDAGVFDDIKKLNELKDTLKVNLEERAKLRGLGATSTEFTQATSPILEKNYIESATLSNIVITNIAAIDQRINDKYTSDVFLYESKNKRLDNITKTYGDIITEQQKADIEVVKQKNAVDLANLNMMNDITKNAATEAIKANPSKASEILKAVQSGDTSKLYAISGNTTLSDDKVNETLTTINKIDNMFNNKKGLAGSIGPTWFGKFLDVDAGFSIGEMETFRTDAKNLSSQATIDYFLKVKASGATFGAMSDSEWEILSQANPSNSLGLDRTTGTSNLPEEEFKKRLESYQNVAKKAIVANELGKLNKDPSFLKNATKEELNVLYNDYSSGKQINYQDELSGKSVSSNFIQKEEGFSPTAYKDQAGVWTIGYGTTKINGQPVKPTDTITEVEAKKVALTQAATEYSTFADKLGETIITPNQFVALNSFEYNLGPGVWNQPTGKQILASIQGGDLNTAQSLMQKFVNVRNPQTGKLESNETLIARRQREGKLLLS